MFCMSGRYWLFCHPQVYHLGLLKSMLPAWILYVLTLPPHTWKILLNLRPSSPQFLPEPQEIFYLYILRAFFPTFLMHEALGSSRGQVVLFCVLRCSPWRAAGTVFSQTLEKLRRNQFPPLLSISSNHIG